MGSTNNAPQQNAAANQQIGQNTAAAQANFGNWLAANPFPLNGISAPKGPTQSFGTAPGQNFGGPSGGAAPNAELFKIIQQAIGGKGPKPIPGAVPGKKMKLDSQNAAAPPWMKP